MGCSQRRVFISRFTQWTSTIWQQPSFQSSIGWRLTACYFSWFCPFFHSRSCITTIFVQGINPGLAKKTCFSLDFVYRILMQKSCWASLFNRAVFLVDLLDHSLDLPGCFMYFVGKKTRRMFNFMNILLQDEPWWLKNRNNFTPVFCKGETRRNQTRFKFGRWFEVFPICPHHQVFSNLQQLIHGSWG